MNPTEERGGGTASSLRRLAREHAGPRLTLGELMEALGGEGYGLLVLLLTLPNLVPAPPIPGYSVPFALGLAALGLQMIIGFRQPRLPRWMLRQSMSFARFRRFVDGAEPRLLRMERLIRPRPGWLTRRAGGRLIGCAFILMSAVLALPLPLGNTPLNISFVIMGLGFLEEDRRALAWGLSLGLIGLIWNALIILAGAEAFAAFRGAWS